VRVEGARPGDHVVLNQNWDAGWTADGAPTVAYKDAVAAVATAADETIHFRFAPRTLGWGVALFAMTLAGIGVVMARQARSA
jgi:hypothetical protein